MPVGGIRIIKEQTARRQRIHYTETSPVSDAMTNTCSNRTEAEEREYLEHIKGKIT